MRKLMVFSFVLSLVLSAGVMTTSAQDTDYCETLSSIEYSDTVTGNITDAEYLDGYCFDSEAGDVVTITASATSGDLDTILTLSDVFAEELFAENDDDGSGSTDSQIVFTIPENGTYLIVVSRYDVEEGTTTGKFELTLEGSGSGGGGNTDDGGVPIADASEVITITCDTGETLYGGVQFGFINIVPGFQYTVTVFGVGDYDPVVAVETQPGIGTCNDDEPLAASSFVSLPGEGSVRANRLTAQVRFSLPRAGSPIITVGSFNGQGGEFVMVIEGLAIATNDEADGFMLRVPSAVVDETLGVYMISRYTDLDPYLQVALGEGLNDAIGPDGTFDPDFIDFDNVFIEAECDDAGYNDCSEMDAMSGGGIDIANGSDYITGEYDAGLQGTPETTDPMLFVFSSSSSASSGTYAILVTGTIPSINLP